MKILLFKLVVLSLLTVSFGAAAATNPVSCQELLERSISDRPFTNELEEAVAAAFRDSKKVIELKLQAHNYGLSQGKVYGNYLKQVQIKADIDQRISEATEEKRKYLEESDAILLSLVNADSESYRHILWERTKAIKRFNKRIDKADAEWQRKQKAYYNAVAEWAPYGYQLKNLEELEKSLLLSLENLRGILVASYSAFDELLRHLKQWSPARTKENCTKVNETISALLGDAQ